MTLIAAIEAGRLQAQALMVDACAISHSTGRTTNASTGVVTDTYGAPFYTGPCKVQARDVDPSNPEAGDAVSTVLRLSIHVPMTVTGVQVNDRITVTSSTYDPDLVGKNFRVVAPFHKSQSTARRLPVEETS